MVEFLNAIVAVVDDEQRSLLIDGKPVHGRDEFATVQQRRATPGLPHFATHRYPEVLTRIVAVAGVDTLLPISLNHT